MRSAGESGRANQPDPLPLAHARSPAGEDAAEVRIAGGDTVAVPDLDQVTGLTGERSEVWARVKDADFLTDEEKRQAVGY